VAPSVPPVSIFIYRNEFHTSLRYEAIPNLLFKADTYIESIPKSRILGLVHIINSQAVRPEESAEGFAAGVYFSQFKQGDPSMAKKLSTGVLVRDPTSVNAHVDVVNLDPDDSRTVTVEIFDWGVDQLWNDPKPVLVSPSGPTAIGPHTNQAFLAEITQATTQPGFILAHYEIRITVPTDKDVVVNCFALDSDGRIIPVNTVIHKNLIEVPVK
jgi:hypothetical protein